MSDHPAVSVQVMALPGPAHQPHALAVAQRLDQRRHPRATYQAIIEALRQGLRLGLTQVLLPPPPLPDGVALVDQGDPRAADPEWLEVLLRSPTVDTQAWATAFAANETSHGEGVVIPANRANERAGQWLAERQRVLATLFAQVDGCRVLPPSPSAPHLADSGQASHLRFALPAVVGGGTPSAAQAPTHPVIHLFGYGDALIMPDTLRARQRVVQSRAAHLLQIRAGGLLPGRSVIARQHWKPLDVGALTLREVICGVDDRWLIHEAACGDQHDLLQALDRLLPGLRLRIIRDGEYRLRDLCRQQGLGGTLLRAADGRYVGLYDPRWADRRAQRLRQALLDEGMLDEWLPDIDPQLLGLRRSGLWRWCIDLSQAQIAQLPAGWVVSEALVDRLSDWAAHYAAPELRIEALLSPAFWDETASADAALRQILT